MPRPVPLGPPAKQLRCRLGRRRNRAETSDGLRRQHERLLAREKRVAYYHSFDRAHNGMNSSFEIGPFEPQFVKPAIRLESDLATTRQAGSDVAGIHDRHDPSGHAHFQDSWPVFVGEDFPMSRSATRLSATTFALLLFFFLGDRKQLLEAPTINRMHAVEVLAN